jgi:hypothetical protein
MAMLISAGGTVTIQKAIIGRTKPIVNLILIYGSNGPRHQQMKQGAADMPQTTPERAARWPGMDAEACKFLEDSGFRCSRDWEWSHPEKKKVEDLTEREADAIIYLIEEWDYGGFTPVTLTDRGA